MVSQILTYFLFVVVFIQFLLSHFLSSYKNKAHNDQEQQRKSKFKISDRIHLPSLTKRKEDSSITFDPLTIDNDQSEQPKEKKIKLTRQMKKQWIKSDIVFIVFLVSKREIESTTFLFRKCHFHDRTKLI